MVINIHCRGDNKLLDDGKLDEQIISDLEAYLEDRERYQKEHLDAKVKGTSHHYGEWTEENQQVVKYASRILECMKTQANHGSDGDKGKSEDEFTKQVITAYVFADFDIRSLYKFVDEGVTDELDKKLVAESILSSALRRAVAAFCGQP